VTDGASSNGRDQRGRFATGNAGGPGGSRKRAFVLRRAAEEAITEEHIQVMMRKALRMALEGNLSAMRFVMERVVGRAAEAPAEAEAVDLTLSLRTAADCSAAIEKLAQGICQGSLDCDVARVLIDAIQTRLKAIEVNELEERLANLEKSLGTVDRSGAPLRRL
jgi:hypothetical protein